MIKSDLPFVKDVVLVGGGHTHALVLKRWGMKPTPGVRLTLINPAPTAPYTGMLPGFVAGHYERTALEINLVRLARFAGARIVLGMASGIDRNAKVIRIDGRPPIPYDIASIDIGITSDMPNLPGFDAYGVPAKPLGPFAARWSQFLARDDAGPIAVIGGGVAGVELAMAMAHARATRGINGTVRIIERGKLLAGASPNARKALLHKMPQLGIESYENIAPKELLADAIHLEDGREIASVFTVGAAGARPFDWLSETGIATRDGYIEVDETLRATNDPSIYAVGDCAYLSHAPRPKAGVFAVRAAPTLIANIRADLTGSARRAFRPQAHYLKLISLGDKSALAEKYGHAIGGKWAWRWKDWIDQRFMNRLADLPAMKPAPVPKDAAIGVNEARGPKPQCGGCGAKVGASILDAALARLPENDTPDVLAPIGDDAAVLNFGATRQVISTDHFRAFWEDPFVMTRIAALHAMGDVWAMGAKPQSLLAQITLPPMTEKLQAGWLDDCLAAAQGVARETGAALIGGHTASGLEFSIGFTVTGTIDSKAKNFAQGDAGDVLILTRPVGTGTLLAADMALAARGPDIANAIAQMSRAQTAAAAILAREATALTDVTGFGLAGHLARMAEASGVTAELVLDAVAFLPGAVDLAQSGHHSTLYPANRAAFFIDVPDTAPARLLFDPQTAGGLLAAIPKDRVEQTLVALIEAGEPAHQIGQLIPAEATGPLRVI